MANVEPLAVPFKIFRVTFLSVPISIGFPAAVRGVLMVQQIISTVHGEITVVISQFSLWTLPPSGRTVQQRLNHTGAMETHIFNTLDTLLEHPGHPNNRLGYNRLVKGFRQSFWALLIRI